MIQPGDYNYPTTKIIKLKIKILRQFTAYGLNCSLKIADQHSYQNKIIVND